MLCEEVDIALRHVLGADKEERDLVLYTLFSNVSSKMNARARASWRDGPLPNARYNMDVHYYEVLARHVAQTPGVVADLLPLFKEHWSSGYLPAIFALLFHLWLFDSPTVPGVEDGLDTQGETLRLINLFTKGVVRLLWLDIEANERRFHTLFRHVAYEVVQKPGRIPAGGLPAHIQRELASVASKFFLYYESPGAVKYFLDGVAVGPCSLAFRESGMPIVDFFAIEILRQMQAMKIEQVLILYLSKLPSVLRTPDIKLERSTMAQLQRSLYRFTTPGGFIDPPVDVRRAAKEAINLIWPEGRLSRTFVRLWWRAMTSPTHAANLAIMIFVEHPLRAWRWLIVHSLIFWASVVLTIRAFAFLWLDWARHTFLPAKKGAR